MKKTEIDNQKLVRQRKLDIFEEKNERITDGTAELYLQKE